MSMYLIHCYLGPGAPEARSPQQPNSIPPDSWLQAKIRGAAADVPKALVRTAGTLRSIQHVSFHRLPRQIALTLFVGAKSAEAAYGESMQFCQRVLDSEPSLAGWNLERVCGGNLKLPPAHSVD
jgi:hypothetical protein